ncbi:uncharacterized protein LOC119594293 [Penaeus monodon]|uniref:uncharacterized protein LOC119594293 n=1 Tax=Penaeus monodon TaxID=6687 RepID=UPI0018A70C9E|nr:uncharacterized protein LOC119594293 [Penaeus monodon]
MVCRAPITSYAAAASYSRDCERKEEHWERTPLTQADEIHPRKNPSYSDDRSSATRREMFLQSHSEENTSMLKCYCLKDIVRLRGLFMVSVVLFSLCFASAEKDFDWKIRVLIVTRATPRDGHLRFFRSLRAAEIPVEIVQTSDENSEISKVLETIRYYNQDEVLMLTNSDQYLATQEAPVAAWTVIGEAARQEAAVLLPFPALPRVMSYEVHDQLERVQELKHLRVREEQHQRQARPDTKSFDAFAFVGLTNSVQHLLDRLETRHHQGSLGTMWRVLAESPGLRKRAGAALDHRYVAFRRANTLETGNFGFRERLDGHPILHTKDLTLPPFLYGTPLTLPASLASMVAREVTFKFICEDCPDEPLPRPRLKAKIFRA